MQSRSAVVEKYTQADIDAGLANSSAADFVQPVDASENPTGQLQVVDRAGGALSSLDPASQASEGRALSETIAGVESLLATLMAQATAKHGTIHHGTVAAYTVALDDADYELHIEEAIDPGPPPVVVAPGAVHFDGADLTSDTFILRILNTTELVGSITWANFAGVFVRNAGGVVNDVMVDALYLIDGDAELLATITNNAGALFLNLFPTAAGNTGTVGGVQAALASLAARLEALTVPVDAGLRASIASLVARIEAVAIPFTGGLIASLASVRAALDAHDSAFVGSEAERVALAETIAGVEARLTVVEDDDDVVGDADTAAIASIVARVEALDIPADSPLHAALASIVGRIEALILPTAGPLTSSLASLRAALDAIDVAATAPVESALAGLQSALDAIDVPSTAPVETAVASAGALADGHSRDLAVGASERVALAETMAGLDSASDVAIDERENLAETIAGIEAILASRGENQETVLGADLALSATAGTYEGVGISAILPGAGRYRITATIRARVIASVVGNEHSIFARLFDATGVVAVDNSERLVLSNANTTAMGASATIVAIVDVSGARQIDLQAARFAASGVNTIRSNANGRTSILWERMR